MRMVPPPRRAATAAPRARTCAGALALGAVILGLCGRAAAQEVNGFVVDSTTAERLVATSLVLLDTSGKPVAAAFTRGDGGFTVRAPRPGLYRLHATRLGYQELTTESIDLRSQPSASLLLRLYAKPVALPSITVEVAAQRIEARLQEEGFYERKRMGFGHFLTPEMIASRNPFYVTDLLKGMAGVRVLYSFGRPTGVRLRAGDNLIFGRSCPPAVLVDGVERGGELNDVIDVGDLSALEIYPNAVGMPMQAGGINGSCGAVVLWTKRGVIPRPAR